MPNETTAITQIGGALTRLDELSQKHRELQDRYNVILPGGSGAAIPPLYAVAYALVTIPQGDRYNLPGRQEIGIGKNGLNRLAAAAGLSWDPSLCYRVDDGSHPWVVHCQAGGTLKQLDGSLRTSTAHRPVDLRGIPGDESSWSAEVRNVIRIAEKSNARDKAEAERKGRHFYPRDPWEQVAQARSQIALLSETKAKNRVIRDLLAVRTSYLPVELDRGFAVFRLQFTGASEDPEIRRAVAAAIIEREMGARNLLYPSRSTPGLHLPALSAPPAAALPPSAATVESEVADEPLIEDHGAAEVGAGQQAEAPAEVMVPTRKGPRAVSSMGIDELQLVIDWISVGDRGARYPWIMEACRRRIDSLTTDDGFPL